VSVFVIAGVPRSGKSTIARTLRRALATEREASVLPVDALVSTLGATAPDLGITHLTEDIGAVSGRLAPMIVELARHLEYEGGSWILDVYQCTPRDLRSAIAAAGPRAPAMTVWYVGYPSTDAAEKRRDIRTHAQQGDWTEELSDGDLERLVERFISESRELERQCREVDWEFTDTGHDFDARVADAVARLRL
jgi:chloramphenicol 3-O-phosphotransferase